MDFSAANTELWNPIVQVGTIAALILFANVLRRKIKFIRTSLMPTAVLAGFILLIARTTGILQINMEFCEKLTYHMLALGFIALSLRTPDKTETSAGVHGSKNGALIVATYMVQAFVGLTISLILAYTLMPDFFKAGGILLPMAYGQGPGQANNVGSTYEALGMIGGKSFGLSLAAVGYLVACVVGVVYMNILNRRGVINRVADKDEVSGSVTIDLFQDNNEIPVAQSVDKASVQFALIMIIYLVTYLFTAGIVLVLNAIAPGVAKTVGTLLWGFNFIIGSIMASACRVLFTHLKRFKLMNHQYQNNYLLSRISGLAFDLMIVAGIASIDISDLSGYWLPFLLMAVLGGIATFYFLLYMCKKLYRGYEYEGFFSMFGMLTGTLSSGVLLLRELDPDLKTPASENLITGSSFGIIFGAPVLLLVSFAAKNDGSVIWTLLLVAVYFTLLILFIFKGGKKNK